MSISRMQRQPCPSQAGFTLVELMIALTIGLFILAGLVTLLYSLMQTSKAQTGLSGFQDNERVAMLMVSNIVGQGGYFPVNTSSGSSQPTTATGAMPETSSSSYNSPVPFQSAGQGLVEATPGVLSVRFVSGSTNIGLDGVMNCIGQTSTGASVEYINTFSVDSSGNLICTTSTPSVSGTSSTVLATGLAPSDGMSFQYGVDTNGDGSVDGYYTGASLNASGGSAWSNVKTVLVTMTFVNPLAATDPGQSATISLTQTVKVMNN